MKATTKKTVIFTIEMTEEEAELIIDGIGNTSEFSRLEIGMSKESSDQMYNLYHTICELLENSKRN